NLSPGKLQYAENYARSVFAKAGVNIQWKQCYAGVTDPAIALPCQQQLDRNEFWLLFESSKPPGATSHMLGFTGFDDAVQSVTHTAAVYVPAVEDMALMFSVDSPAVLGAVSAHEIGHMLLGANAHSREGVMYARWGREQMTMVSTQELLF